MCKKDGRDKVIEIIFTEMKVGGVVCKSIVLSILDPFVVRKAIPKKSRSPTEHLPRESTGFNSCGTLRAVQPELKRLAPDLHTLHSTGNIADPTALLACALGKAAQSVSLMAPPQVAVIADLTFRCRSAMFPVELKPVDSRGRCSVGLVLFFGIAFGTTKGCRIDKTILFKTTPPTSISVKIISITLSRPSFLHLFQVKHPTPSEVIFCS